MKGRSKGENTNHCVQQGPRTGALCRGCLHRQPRCRVPSALLVDGTVHLPPPPAVAGSQGPPSPHREGPPGSCTRSLGGLTAGAGEGAEPAPKEGLTNVICDSTQTCSPGHPGGTGWGHLPGRVPQPQYTWAQAAARGQQEPYGLHVLWTGHPSAPHREPTHFSNPVIKPGSPRATAPGGQAAGSSPQATVGGAWR